MNAADDIAQLIAEHIPDLLLVVDELGMIRYASPSYRTAVGVRIESLLLQPYYSGIAEEDVPAVQHAWALLQKNGSAVTLEYRYARPESGMLWVEGKMTAVREGNRPTYTLIAARDISSRKLAEEELQHLAYYDPLTGLPNRRLFQDRYTQALLSAKRYGHRLALLYLDLDNFKGINDAYGHAVGDQLLKIASARLVNCLRDPDTICRLGGDEFVILLQQFEEQADVEKIARRMIESLSQLIYLHQHEIKITCSMGAAIYPEDSTNGETLIQLADAAMYMSKKEGKNHFSVYNKKNF